MLKYKIPVSYSNTIQYYSNISKALEKYYIAIIEKYGLIVLLLCKILRISKIIYTYINTIKK